MKIRAAEAHARLGNSWPAVLVQLGVPEHVLRNKHGPCPGRGCGGKDRFRFDNKHGHGDFFCNQCGAGDGFKLLQLVHGWSFSEALDRVVRAAGLTRPNTAYAPLRTQVPTPIPQEAPRVAMPSVRVLRLRRERCAIENCDDAMSYLASRGLWPLPPGCSLQAHANAEYWDRGEASEMRRIGRYPAILADVVDGAGELVTVHTTYLQGGKKLEGYEPRKILSPMTGRDGCAVRLMPAADVLGVAEGIETALSAAALDGIPVWAALNTALLSKFEPPPGVTTLRVYADRDEAGLTATSKLQERLQGRLWVESRIPSAPAKDWNDVLIVHNGRTNGKGSSHE